MKEEIIWYCSDCDEEYIDERTEEQMQQEPICPNCGMGDVFFKLNPDLQ